MLINVILHTNIFFLFSNTRETNLEFFSIWTPYEFFGEKVSVWSIFIIIKYLPHPSQNQNEQREWSYQRESAASK